MNKRVHRLVFDRRRGMCVPAAEHTRSAGKAGSGQCGAPSSSAASASVIVALGASLALGSGSGLAATRSLGTMIPRTGAVQANKAASGRPMQNLPQRVRDYSTGNADGNPADVGKFTIGNVNDTTLQINQSDSKVIINWDSFDIGRGYTVRFVQPSSSASALNNIWDINPSVILGRIEANGEVLLQNQNGILFGPTARVDTQRFVATALKLADEAFMKGVRKASGAAPVFGSDTQGDAGFISIERGAQITALAGGDVIMVAPKVYNEGLIQTPGGQTVLAAGKKVYLYGPTDASRRGLWVAVDAFDPSELTAAGGNTVEVAAKEVQADGTVLSAGQVSATTGSINLVGMVVRQNGKLSATTAVKGQNGGIFLQASKSAVAPDLIANKKIGELGSVEFGEGSITQVTPSDDGATQKDAETFYRSRIEVLGNDIRVRSGAELTAVSGNIDLLAASSALSIKLISFLGGNFPTLGGASIVVDPGAKLSVAGWGSSLAEADLQKVTVAMSRNQGDLQLFQSELADSPVQRGGVVYRNEVYFDARKPVALANVKGFYNLINRDAYELSTRGGNIHIVADGSVVLADGAKLDISGGALRYAAGQVFESVLGLARGGAVTASQAKASTRYAFMVNPGQQEGDTGSLGGIKLSDFSSPVEASYLQGADAGSLTVAGGTRGEATHLGADLAAGVVVGPYQRQGAIVGGYASAVSTAEGVTSLDSSLAAELGRASKLITQPHLYASLRPLGGSVTLNSSGGDIHLSQVAGLNVGFVPEVGSEDWASALASWSTQTWLSSSKLQASRLSQLNIGATAPAESGPQSVLIDADFNLNLGNSGSFSAGSSQSGAILMAGQIRAPGGSVLLGGGTGGTVVATTAVLDVSGGSSSYGVSSVTDPSSSDGSAYGELASIANGGTLTVNSRGSVTLQEGALLDVSGVLLRSATSGSVKGAAGTVNLKVNDQAAGVSPDAANTGKLTLGATLKGYDFASGGTLNIEGVRTALIGALPDPTDTRFEQGLKLGTGFFSEGGFGTFSLKAMGDILVSEGTQLTPVLSNLVEQTVGNAALQTGRPQGTDSVVRNVAVQQLAAGLRKPVSITLDASGATPYLVGADEPQGLDLGGTLTVGKGALIDAGLGGSVALKAYRRVDLWGGLVAHGGTVAVGLTTSGRLGTTVEAELDQIGYLADQAVHLHAGSRIDASGVAKVVVASTNRKLPGQRAIGVGNLADRVTGSVLGGGVVNLNLGAPKGWVVAEAGSTIDVSGAAADLNLTNTDQTTRVSAGAGTVNVASAYGFYLGGTMLAARPDASVSGGSFNATSSTAGVTYIAVNSSVDRLVPYPVNGSAEMGQVNLLATTAEVVAADLKFGTSAVSAQGLLEAGFDRIGLKASERIVLGEGASLKGQLGVVGQSVPLRSVVLDAPVLQAEDSGTHTVQASYVGLGSEAASEAVAAASATAGNAKLHIEAGLIEVYGNRAVQGFKETTLDATLSKDHVLGARRDGEVRLIGSPTALLNGSTTESFNTKGTLNLRAGNVYATTLSNYVVDAGTDGQINLKTPEGGSTSAAPLSALARLSFKAGTIDHDGSTLQPFGQISLQAPTVTLGANSVMSVSGAGLNVPVGVTLNGQQWLYGTKGTAAALTSADTTVKVLDGSDLGKRIKVEGADGAAVTTLTVDAASRIEAQAGGDLLAWEFVQGVGGTTDTFNRANVYAIVPGYSYDFAPYDVQTAATAAAVGQKLGVGDQVRVTTANGVLAPGVYTLMPARYGVLPGAVLVSTTTLTTGQALNKATLQDDGSVIVSGYKTNVGTQTNGGNNPNLALVLEPEATFRAKSSVAVNSVNTYLAAKAERLGEATPVQPSAGGRVSLAASRGFDWRASYKLLGGELDLSMGIGQLAVVNGDQATPKDAVRVSAEALSATQADSILLGGLRDGSGSATTIKATASSILIAGDVTAGELITVAQNGVELATGASLTVRDGLADTANTQVFTITGQGAALAVSQNTALDLRRDLSTVSATATPSGKLTVAAGSTLKGGSVVTDASQTVSVADDLTLETRNLVVGAQRIAVGEGEPTAGALALTGKLLEQVNTVQSATLRSYSSLDLLGSATLGQASTKKLVIDAREVRGQGKAEDTAVIQAANVVLRNTTGTVADGGNTGASTLVVKATPALSDVQTGGITVGEGKTRLAFATASLQSQGDIVFDGQGADKNKLSSQGDLTLSAARVTATTGAKHSADSGGVLTVAKQAGSRTLGERVGLGGQLALSGQRVLQQGLVELNSGAVTLSGTGQTGRADTVVLAEGSRTSTAGVIANAGKTWAVSSGGGTVTAKASKGDVHVLGEVDVSAGVLALTDATGKVTGYQKASESDTAKAAGTITLQAVAEGAQVVFGANAGLIGRAATDSLSGNLKVDAGQVSNASNVAASTRGTLDQLAKLANEGGMHGSVDVRVRAADAAQSLDTTMKAVRTRLSVDKSSLTLMSGAVIDAAVPQGGLVQLSAKGLSMDKDASIGATSSRTGAQGGDVLLSSVDGGVLSLNEGATVDAGLGRIVLRANRDDTAADDAPLTDILKIDPVKASLKATEVLVEANRIYEGYTSVAAGSSSGLALGQDDLATDTATFMARKDSLLTALGLADQANVHLRSGVEIRSTGDLTINGDWNLWQADRAGGEPIVLTLRAGKNLYVKGSISDGFETATRAAANATEPSVMAEGAAASLRLVAGADSDAADLLTTHAKETGGDLVIDARKMVRTTAGSIEMAAANNIELKVQSNLTFSAGGSVNTQKANVVPEQAVVYVAGKPATLADGDTSLASSNVWARYTEGGGRLEAMAGNDIKAPGASQLFGNWLYHAASVDIDSGAVNADAASWWSVLDSFKQGLGSFGGGNTYVQAQGNIVNLGVVSPTSGRNVLSDTGEVAMAVGNGGDVTIKAGGDIQGGAFLLGRGEGRIEAGGAIVTGSNLNTKVAGVGAILGLMDGHWLVQARGDVQLTGVYNPTVPTTPSARMPESDAFSFFTYLPDTSLSLSSAAGNVSWNSGSLSGYHSYLQLAAVGLMPSSERMFNSPDAVSPLLQVAPPVVHLVAMEGNTTIDVAGAASLMLFPSASGDLSIFAGRNVQLQSHGQGGMVMADGDPSRWPSVNKPAQERSSATTSTLVEKLGLPELFPAAVAVPEQKLTVSTLHADDALPARVFAGEDIAFSADDSTIRQTQFNLTLPKKATLEATGDILNPEYSGQHFHDSDVTLIKAGGNVVGSTAKVDNRTDAGFVQLYGPGELQIEAGRRLDLRTSAGVQTLGNTGGYGSLVTKQGNTALGEESASIRVSAGMNKALKLDEFAALYLTGNPQAQAELVAYVTQTLKLGQAALPEDVQAAYPQALALFAGFSKAHQVGFAQGLLDRAFVARYVAPGQAYAQAWQDFATSKGVQASDLQGAVFGQFKDEVVMAEVRRLGSQAVDLADSSDPGLNAQRQAQRDALWAQVDVMSSLAGLGQGFGFVGDVDLGGSKVHTLGNGSFTQGGIDFFVPGGGVLVGYNAALADEKLAKVAAKRGLVTYDGGSIRSFSERDFQVNTQKAFVVGTGDVVVYSRSGDIDSGRGSNTDVTVPPPVPETDPDTGVVSFVSPAVTKGSGIGLLKNAAGGAAGTIELFTPKGTVRALDTFITSESGGEIRVAGTILGADNIKGTVKGGAPAVAGPSLKVGTTLPSDTAAGIEAVTAASQSGQRKEANAILTVELLNLGDGSDGGTAPAAGTKKPCKPDDKDCDKP